MVADPSRPTRAELERVANGDYRLLRALERLFEVAGELTPAQLAEIRELIEQVQAELEAVTTRVKSNEVLLWLTM